MSLLNWLNPKKRKLEDNEEVNNDTLKKNVCSDINQPKFNTSDNDGGGPSKCKESETDAEASCSVPITAISDFPDCWTNQQVLYFTSENKWLVIRNKKIGCKVCFEVSKKGLGTQKGVGIRLANEWVNCLVTANGDDKAKQQRSLRKKIFEHKDTIGHSRAENILDELKKKRMESTVNIMNKKHLETTVRIFRTAYKIAKLNRPFTDFPVDVQLQELNGVDMGRVLHSKSSCTNIIDHISDEMRREIARYVIENKIKLSVLVDESTTISKKSVLVICLRCAIGVNDDNIQSFFGDLVELQDTKAQSITEAILNNLNSFGMTQEFLKTHFIGFACDGASVMLGRKIGVATELKKQFPNLIVWHCSNHRLELAVHDTRNEVAGVNHFHFFFDKLYSVYSMSPKNQRELSECAAALGQKMSKIGKIFTIRWVSSSYRTVKAVWDNYSSLVMHFDAASADQNRESKERVKYGGLSNILKSSEFITNMGIIYDSLTELSDLSLELQKRSMTLPAANNLIKRTVRIFESMLTSPGEYFENANKASEQMLFKGVVLHSNTRLIKIKPEQFFGSLVTNLKERLVTSINKSESDEKISNILKDIEILYKENWPNTDTETNITFGDKSISNLCDLFHVLNKREIINAFRDYVESQIIPTSLKPFLKIIATIPVSSSECERAFSTMNNVMTDTRNALLIERASRLIFISCVGPPLKNFFPQKYAESWLRAGKRSADETACPKVKDDSIVSQYEPIWQLLQ